MHTFHHIYPFRPFEWHGGNLRLRTALEASNLIGSASLSWWERSGSGGCWRDALPEIVGSPDPKGRITTHFGEIAGLRHRLFPSALWETGYRPRRGAKPLPLGSDSDATLVIHTSYLAPMARALARQGRRVVIDVHDVVFRAQFDDAQLASGSLRSLREAYARSVKLREIRALGRADAFAVAGWDDRNQLSRCGVDPASWAPTGLEADLSPAPDSDRICVGLIGNFAYSATAATAEALVRSPLGSDPGVQLLFAGLGSEGWARDHGTTGMGTVAHVNDFYSRVHATVVPVLNGCGMKCKLAESALAGKPVITTRPGAMGYPPHLSNAFTVVDDIGLLGRQTIADELERATPQALRDTFLPEVGREAAAATYAQLLRSASLSQGASRASN